MTLRTLSFSLMLPVLFLVASCNEFGDPSGTSVATSLVSVGSQNPSGQAGEPLVLRVRATDASGSGVPGVEVTWSSTSGTLASNSTVTGANGEAEVTWTMGSTMGNATATASAQGLSTVTFTVDVGAGRPATLVLSHQNVDFTAVGQTQQVTATSVEDQFGNPITGASLSWVSGNTGVATVNGNGVITAAGSGTTQVTATADTATATVQVSVSGTGGGGGTSCDSHGTLTLGGSGSGTIDSSDCPLSDFFAEVWELTLSEDTVARFDLTGNVDVLVAVADEAGDFIGSNDDIPSGSDSHLELPLSAGTYLVYAVNLDGGTGSYTLDISGGTTPSCSLTGSMGVPQTVNGTFDLNDCLFDDGSREDYWSLTVSTGGDVQIDLSSTDVDTWLWLFDSDGNVVAENDDIDGDAGNFNSRITVTLAAGSYTILATTAGGGQRGDYTLTTANASAYGATVSADPAVTLDGVKPVPWSVPSEERRVLGVRDSGGGGDR